MSRSQVAAVLESYADALVDQRTDQNGAGSTPSFDRWLRTTAEALRAA